MNQLEEYISQVSRRLTTEEIEEAVRAVPLVRAEAATIDIPVQFPELRSQVDLLCQFIEDVYGGQLSRDDAGGAYLEAVFAIAYFNRKVDIIPDHLPGIGKLDDAVVVTFVLRRNQAILQAYAQAHGLPWSL